MTERHLSGWAAPENWLSSSTETRVPLANRGTLQPWSAYLPTTASQYQRQRNTTVCFLLQTNQIQPSLTLITRWSAFHLLKEKAQTNAVITNYTKILSWCSTVKVHWLHNYYIKPWAEHEQMKSEIKFLQNPGSQVKTTEQDHPRLHSMKAGGSSQKPSHSNFQYKWHQSWFTQQNDRIFYNHTSMQAIKLNWKWKLQV